MDGAMPPKSFRSLFIALLRPSLGVPRHYRSLQLTSSNRGYPCSRRSLTGCMDKMTVPPWREPKSRPLWMTLVKRVLPVVCCNRLMSML
jgi:hypothetical protein